MERGPHAYNKEATAMMLGRRSFMITGAAAADGDAGGGSAWAAETPIRYPDPNIKVLDPRFQRYVLGNAAIERLAGGCRFTEGPVWFGDGRYLLWSDIPNDRIVKWEEETGAISVFRRPSHYANGNTRDRQGRLITCEMDAQRLTRTEYDGTITVLADRFEGKRLTAPNDVVVKSDGSIWFSDNGAGTRGNYLGHTPTVCLDVISLVASSCGYDRGQIEQRAAHEFAVHVATQRGLAKRPQHRHPPRAQPVAPIRERHCRRPRRPPRRGTDQAPYPDKGPPGCAH